MEVEVHEMLRTGFGVRAERDAYQPLDKDL
jgi:hypothetical protein